MTKRTGKRKLRYRRRALEAHSCRLAPTQCGAQAARGGHTLSSSAAGRRAWLWVALALVFCLPGLVLRIGGIHLDPLVGSAIYGIGILSAAFLLSWAAEAAQEDVSASLAIAVLALITILPEYAVEAVLAWKAGAAFAITPDHPAAVGLVAANVTGANRLLIGLAWPLVVLVFWLRQRATLTLPKGLSLELTILLVATLITFLFLVTKEVNFALAGVLIALYFLYLWLASTKPAGAPELEGPAAAIAALPKGGRRAVVLALFAYAAAAIFAAAEPFVEGLIQTGQELGVDEFFLIQWVAPLASESPEIVVALLFALRGNPAAGITALISAEVNQLTLLVGSMPVIFSISLGQAHAFPLDPRQVIEFLLTSSLSLFAIALIARMRITLASALVLLGFFVGQLFFPGGEARRIAALVLLGLTAAILIRDPGRVRELARMAKTVVRGVLGRSEA